MHVVVVIQLLNHLSWVSNENACTPVFKNIFVSVPDDHRDGGGRQAHVRLLVLSEGLLSQGQRAASREASAPGFRRDALLQDVREELQVETKVEEARREPRTLELKHLLLPNAPTQKNTNCVHVLKLNLSLQQL